MDPRDPSFFSLIKEAVLEGRRLVLALEKDGRHIGSYWDWPELSWLEGGFPSIHLRKLSGPTNYAMAFSPKEGRFAGPIIYSEVKSFRDLIEYGLRNERIHSYFSPGPGAKPEARDSFVRISIAMMAEDIIDRSIHMYGDDEINNSDILAIYLELEAPIFENTLPVEILVPIALTKFDIQGRVSLSESIDLEEMDQPTHLARYPRDSFWLPAHGIVISAATHALVLGDYQIPPETMWQRHRSELSFYPVEVVDRFFAALRLVTGTETGYAQIVLRPKGWAEDYIGSLPPLIPGPSVHNYPAAFDNYGWLRTDRHIVSTAEVREVAQVFAALSEAEQPLSLATRRLNSAMLRTDEADAIIDLCIGLEALLTDDDKTELTHKLALRVAAILALAGNRVTSPDKVFSSVKLIYKYRSKLVHGRTDAEALSKLAVEGNEVRTVKLATDYLRSVIGTLLKQPQYLVTQKIDTELIAGSLTGVAATPGDE